MTTLAISQGRVCSFQDSFQRNSQGHTQAGRAMITAGSQEYPMTDHDAIQGLTEAVQRYFDLLYDVDLSRFDQVFCPTAQLHGLRDGKLVMWPAETYRE